MPFSLEDKIVVGISTRALFDLEKENKIFEEQGIEAYREYQEANENVPLNKGVAFPFIKRLLTINKVFPEEQPIEVVLLSRNSAMTGLRVFNSLEKYWLNISRGAFMSGSSAIKYIPAFNISLFLSMDEKDVAEGIKNGFPAGHFLSGAVDDEGNELRIAFDFDGVIADDSSEKIYQNEGITPYHKHEQIHGEESLGEGPLSRFFRQIAAFQKLEREKLKEDPKYKKILRTAIVTARNAPAHKRIISTLKAWNVEVDEMLLLGGADKTPFLKQLRPHVYFDDQDRNLQSLREMGLPAVHIPFGVLNEQESRKETEGANGEGSASEQ